MKKLFIPVLGICLAFSVKAQEVTTAANVVKTTPVDGAAATAVTTPDESLLVLKETEFNFGKIPQGKPVNHIFYVDNKSKDSLHIVNVQASCGCTTPEWEKDKAVAPGASTKITVGYNAAAEGAFTKFITITYNGTNSKQITITGEVWKTPASSAPENKSLNDLKN
jgi:hypothetical protein